MKEENESQYVAQETSLIPRLLILFFSALLSRIRKIYVFLNFQRGHHKSKDPKFQSVKGRFGFITSNPGDSRRKFK